MDKMAQINDTWVIESKYVGGMDDEDDGDGDSAERLLCGSDGDESDEDFSWMDPPDEESAGD